MFEIKDNIIKLTKGDSAVIRVEIVFENGDPYVMGTGDVLRFTVRKKPTSDILLQVESSTNIINIPHSQTQNLEPGSCCYDIELTTASGEVFTVVGLSDNWATNMIVLSEVTY